MPVFIIYMFSRSIPKVIVYISPKVKEHTTTNPTCDKFIWKQYNSPPRTPSLDGSLTSFLSYCTLPPYEFPNVNDT